MPFWRTRLSAKQLHGRRWRIRCGAVPNCSTKQGGPSTTAPSFSLPMMRWATSHTASIPRTSYLPTTTSVEQAFKLRRHPRID